MKKTIVLLSAVAMLFCGLWIYEIFDNSDTKELCQHYAKDAFETFQSFERSKEYNEKNSTAPLADYHYAMSKFYAFTETLRLLVGEDDSFYKDCSDLHSQMNLATERVIEHMDELLDALEIVANDYTDKAGHRKINGLQYFFQYGEYLQ